MEAQPAELVRLAVGATGLLAGQSLRAEPVVVEAALAPSLRAEPVVERAC